MSLRPQPIDTYGRGRFQVKSEEDLNRERIVKLEEQVASLRLMVLRLAAKVEQIDAVVEGVQVGPEQSPSNSERSDPSRR